MCGCSFARINVSESHQSPSVLSCAFSLVVCALVCLAIGTQRRRSPSSIASEIFEPHLGSHILQVGIIHCLKSTLDIVALFTQCGRYPGPLNSILNY